MKTTMKNFGKLLAVVIMVSGFHQVGAAEKDGGFYFNPLTENKATVSVVNPQNQHIKLSVLQDDGSVVYYNENFKNQQKLSKVFDFSNLNDGMYVIKADVSGEVFEKKFEKFRSELSLVEKAKVAEPIVKSIGNNLIVIVDDKSVESVSLSIANKKEEIYTDESRGVFRKKFVLDDLEPGKYDVSLFVNGELFDYNIDVK